MSATTIAVATRTETIEPPPGSRSGNAALPVPDTVMSGPRLGRYALMLAWCRLPLINSSRVNKDIKAESRLGIKIPEILQRQRTRAQDCENNMTVPQSRHDFVLFRSCRVWGFFPEA